MKAAFYTLGCKVNQNETGALQHLLAEAGYEIVAENEAADVYVVNSCTVTAGGDAKSRQWLRRAKRRNPGAVTVLTGCYPQAFPQEAVLPEADIVTGTVARARLPENIAQFLRTGQQVVDIQPHRKGEAFEEMTGAPLPGRTRAFVKVEDGCNRRCSYCIIPYARGDVRSRPEDAVLAELATLAQHGYREVVFTGINLPSYGRDTGTNLGQLVTSAGAVAGIDRLRLSSLDPDLVTDRLVASFAASQKLCRQFHLSLQSGCDKTLRRMKRPYTLEQYRQAAHMLHTAMPGATFTTDIIVGFPDESEADFAESLHFVREMAFLKVHVFPYSRRPGTPAAEYPNQIPEAEKARRAAALQQAADAVRAEVIAHFAGTAEDVLLETPLQPGVFSGYTRTYIPVSVAAPGAQQGDILPVRLGSYDGERCAACPV